MRSSLWLRGEELFIDYGPEVDDELADEAPPILMSLWRFGVRASDAEHW